MEKTPIISSLLDTDLYKLTILQTVFHQFPHTEAEYEFRCRNQPSIPLANIYAALNEQLDALCSLRFTRDELNYVRSLRFMKTDFVDFLENFQLQRSCIEVECDPDASFKEQIRIKVKGPMVQSLMFEIYELSIVSELIGRELSRGNEENILNNGRLKLKNKIHTLCNAEDARRELASEFPFVFFEFGTRRRFSKAWQEEMVLTLQECVPEYFKGSSNIDLARRFGLTPIGTMAHEYLQAHQALDVNLREFQKRALENWVEEYHGDLGIALTDTISMDAFLQDFDLYYAKLFDGMRHDSGDPFVWGEKAINHYAKMNIDARTKKLIFSDSLNFERALSLYTHFFGRAQTRFGIGTNLSNDLGVESLQIVSKMVRCNGKPVAKLSDSPGKTMCPDLNFWKQLSEVFQMPSAEI